MSPRILSFTCALFFALALVGPAQADVAADTKWIDLLYNDTLGHDPTALQLSNTLTALGMGTPRTTVALGVVQTPEFDTITVQNAYQLYLHRAADQSGLNAFVAQLQSATRDESVFGSLISSNEYFVNRASGDNALFVSALYQDVLHRTPSGLEISNGVSIIQSTSRSAFANAVLTSSEGRGVFVGDWFQLYLGRTGAANEISPFVTQIASGATFDQVRSEILSSTEFYNRAQQVPEPASVFLLGIGGLLALCWRRRLQ